MEAEELLDKSFGKSGFSEFKVKFNIESDKDKFDLKIRITYIDNRNNYEALELSEVEDMYRNIMGRDDWSGTYDEQIDYAKEEAIDSYNCLSKEEYVKRVGMIFYSEKRLDEIYNELKKYIILNLVLLINIKKINHKKCRIIDYDFAFFL